METQEIKQEFEQILSEVIRINGLSAESAISVATAILQESGKFRRTEMLKEARANSNTNGRNGNQPATFSQKRALRNLRITYDGNISKAEASRLIEQAVQQLNRRKQ